ncbi:MAG: hypothetical protein JWM82_1357 [Myxococcales bacterium]|nr:hypothetical protein [Myxococcales bacterium]
MFGSEGLLSTAFALALSLFAGKPVAPAAPAPAAPTAPALITVPASLWQRSATLEPSGVVWVPKLERYLVVSDDTGDASHHHQPWVLAMTRAGAFDEAPVPIAGLDALNDAESICAGPDGLLFLVTSHSPNKRGHDPESRRALLLLELAGRGLRVVGRVDLTTARAAVDLTTARAAAPAPHAEEGIAGALLALAGLPVDGRLDIEAVTFRDGALLIGLKSPLTAKDGAVVLRLAAPVAALRAGKVPPGAVTRLWELPLHVDVAGQAIPQGIADLTTLPDGSIALVANAPKGRAHDDGGALYHFVPGKSEPRLVRRFPGLHPEGVTLAADGKDLVLVFDNNTGPPMWMHWPLPGRAP